MKPMDFFVPVKTVSELNLREHWAVKHKRKKEQQELVSAVMHNALKGKKVMLPCTVKLTRIGPKTLDTDNLAGALKHCQDAVARKLGIDDGDTSKVRWEYEQKAVQHRVYGLKVQISE